MLHYLGIRQDRTGFPPHGKFPHRQPSAPDDDNEYEEYEDGAIGEDEGG